jgi:tetratricopeptide (TPR) repeat protein
MDQSGTNTPKLPQRDWRPLIIIIFLCFSLYVIFAAADSVTAYSAPPNNLSNLARTALLFGNISEADNLSRHAVEAEPNNSYALNTRGIILDQNGRSTEALKCFDKVLELEPRNFDALKNEAVILSKMGKFDESRSILNKATKIYPYSGDLWDKKGYLLKQMGDANGIDIIRREDLYNQSSQAYEKAVQYDPSNREAAKGLLLTYFELNKMDKAIELTDKLSTNDSDTFIKIWMAWGNSSLNTSKNEKAVSAYRTAIKINASNKYSWTYLGKAYLQLNQSARGAITLFIAENIGSNQNYLETVAVFILYLILSIILSILTKTKRIPLAMTILCINLMGFLVSGWIISGILNENEVYLLWIYWFVIVIITGGLWIMLGGAASPWRIRVAWAILDYHKRLKGSISRIDVLIISISFVYALFFILYLYFLKGSPSLSSIDNLSMFMKAMLLTVILFGYLITVPPVIKLLISRNMDQDTRDLIFVTYFGYLCVSSFYLSLAFWLFEICKIDLDIAGTKFISQFVSPYFIVLLFILYICTLLYPYLIGCQRGKRWRELTLNMRTEWINKLLDILEFPTPTIYISKGNDLLEEIKTNRIDFEMRHLHKGDPKIKSPDEISHLEFLYRSDIKRLDPRYSYIEYLNYLELKIKEFIKEVEPLDKNEIEAVAQKYVKILHSRRQEVDKHAIELSQTKPQLMVYLAVLFGPILVQAYAIIISKIEEQTPQLVDTVLNITRKGMGK